MSNIDSAGSEVESRGGAPHSLRARLDAGEFIIGVTITTGNLESAALAAKLGFHFLWVEMEHAPVSLEALRGMVLATRGLPAPVLVRVPVAALWTAKRVLDQGVSGVIFPFISNPELARTAALSCRYPPAGLRGSGAGLAASSWGGAGDNYYDSADAHILTVCIIEEESALAHVDAIAATPGIDVIFIGTSDLSFSMGFRGRQDEPKLTHAIATIVAAAQRHHKFLGRPAPSADHVLRYYKQGFQVFQSVTELGLMRAGAAGILQPLGIQPAPAGEGLLY